jgi:hypothetical protein
VWEAFRQSGLILPFGSYYHVLYELGLNKLVVDLSRGWVMSRDSDPLDGWDKRNILLSGSAYQVPKNDLFGSPFFHVRSQNSKFLRKLEKCQVCFNLS